MAVSGEVHTDTLLHAAILKTQITPGFSQIISESNETPLEALVHISTVGAVFQQWERLGPTLSPGLFGIYSYFVEALEDKEVLITENDQEE